MTGKIFRAILAAAVAVLLCAAGIITGFLYDYFEDLQIVQLRNELQLAAAGTQRLGEAYLQAASGDQFRITWVDAEGRVLFDTQADQVHMENHRDREEIAEAAETGRGSSFRYSDTLTEKTFYEALRLENGTVLRISVSRASLAALMWDVLRPVGVVVILAVCLSAILAGRMARRIVQPINTLDLEHPLDNRVYEEITPLLRRIDQQHRELYDYMKQLRQKAEDFSRVTRHLDEGLVLLDPAGTVLSINPAAEQFFGNEQLQPGSPFRSETDAIRDAMDRAAEEGDSRVRIRRQNREYQLEISRIESEGAVAGTAVLIFDVTRHYEAEQARREFSANVSHELKTPLQSIIGSAELLENNLVRPENVPRFVGHIRKEAARLVSLIEDIIRLSQLDEGVEIPREAVNLQTLAEEVLADLEPQARQKQVTLSLTGEPCTVTGVRRLLHEILYNLCDNGIKYNVAGGKVEVRLGRDRGCPVLTVADTGIGIPREHQDRVFERFYRVDKSHSRQSGGTGLGLSIVKHAAAYHRAALTLVSTPGAGTAVTLTFPEHFT